LTNESRRWRERAAKVPFVDQFIRRLRRSDEISRLQRELEAAQDSQTAVSADRGGVNPDPNSVTIAVTDPSVLPFLTWRPPGHFYSPVPTMSEIERQADRIFAYPWPNSLDGIDLNVDAQLALFEKLAVLALETTFDRKPQRQHRYYTENPGYGLADATVTQSMLRHIRPRRYLEVGSGFSTALALDTNEQWLDGSMQITCIEPYADDLRRLVRPGDAVELIESPVQDVPVNRFAALEPGDLLFIDCSHVVRTGSDAQYLITRVLPAVHPGVYVHIHDIFWPFEYPRIWVEDGRVWSEAYLLHAFLLHNAAFEIVLFNDWLCKIHNDVVRQHLPDLVPGAGGAIWLRRRV
jgi:predicted O-methyltransferase YrrM